MESPPSFSGWSDVHEAPVSIISVSEDSGLPLTSASSVSSGSLCGERVSCGFVESDGEDKSLSQYDSLDYSDGGMCGEHFNTLKKGPHLIHIEPPPEFQDSPPSPQQYDFVPGPNCISHSSLSLDKQEPCVCSQASHSHNTSENTLANCSTPTREIRPNRLNTLRLWPQELAYSPAHSLAPHPRPVSRSSLGSSRLSSSHNSLSVPAANKADDSSFITQAISHDTLTGEISDMYNVPFDSDIYAVPVDMVRPVYDVTENRTPKPKRQGRGHRKRRRNTCATSQCELDRNECENNNSHNKNLLKGRPASHYKSQSGLDSTNGKRHSVPGTSGVTSEEPLHMTLEEVRNYLHTLYSSSSDSSDNKKYETAPKKHNLDCKTNVNNNKYTVEDNALDLVCRNYGNCANKKKTKKTFVINIKNKKVKDVSTTEITKDTQNIDIIKQNDKIKKSTAKNFSLSLKQTLCNIFRFRKLHSPGHLIKKQNFQSKLKDSLSGSVIVEEEDQGNNEKKKTDLCKRALPPLPKVKKDSRKPAPTIKTVPDELPPEDTSMDFTLSIEKVKDYGWYWGPMSGEAAERILSNEPDGSFIVRDSSDSHYIFSLTFKLLGCVRHVRIEHDQGNFSFGSCTKFKSHTIVEFIKNAVEHSRSGRYLFFLHRRPSANGPMRVQLLHPVSRFKQVQSLQHMCRFVILKAVRVDLIPSLPLPRRLIDYLNTKHYYSEQVSDSDSEDYGPHRVTETFGHQEHSINQVSDVLEPLALENIEQDSLIITDRDNIIPRLHIDERDRSVSTEDSERFRIHIIERESSIVTVDVSEREEMSALADVRENNSLNEMEGLRRGGRFRLGLRHERDRRFNNRISKSSVQEWEESNSS